MELPPLIETHSARAEFGWPTEALLIGVPGTIDPTKEPALTLRAFAELRHHRPDARLIFMGDWPLDYGLSDLVRQLKLGKFVEFLGRVEPLARLERAMAACDIIVNLRRPTIGETSGTALRALALGRALVVRDVGWFSEIPAGCSLKIGVAAGVDELVHVLETLAAQPDLRQRLGDAARAHIQAECTVTQVAQRYAAFLQAIFARFNSPIELRLIMRVLFVTNTFPPDYTGGAEVANYHTVRGLIRRGVTCELMFVNNRLPRTAEDWYELDGIPVHRVRFFTRRRTALGDVFDPRVYRAVHAELKRFKPDVVHMQNMSGATLAPYVACRVAGVPVVNTLHDLWLLCPNNMLLRQDLTRCDPYRNHAACYRRYDFWGNVPGRRNVFAALTSNVKVFISPSQAVIDRHVEAGYARDRFQLVRLGFEQTPLPAAEHPGVQRVIAESLTRHTITYAGGGVEIKGARVLLEAIPALLAQDDRLQIAIAGGGEPALLEEFRRIDPRVNFLGWVPFGEMQALYAASDLTLAPSIWHENSPVVILHSHQVGTPVVASNIGGIPELVIADKTGYLFSPGDPAALAHQVARHFAKTPYERRAMRRACVESSRSQWSLDQHLDRHLTIYRQVTA